MYQVFLSHAWGDQTEERRADREERGGAPELLAALKQLDLDVFYDQEEIDEFRPISSAISEALQNSIVFVSWCSDLYLARPACAAELTLAMAWSNLQSNLRVLVINPESKIDHLPIVLRENMVGSAPSPNDTAGFGKIAARIKARCDELVGPSGTLPSPLDVDWFPFGRPQSSVRFTGRFSELLMLHGLFNQTALAGRSDACGAVVIDGIGGAGKTLLALEYAQRFAPAWPGGIVWLNHRGFDRDRLPDRAESRSESMSAHTALATSLGIELDAGADIIEVRSRIARWFVERGRVLWIVDDVPPDADLEVWTSPLPSESATLITSRHTKFGNSSYVPLSLDALSPEDAYTLITRNQRPADGEQRQAAIALCSRVSRHALAVDVTRALVRSPFEFTSQLELLEQRTIERLELAGQVVGDLAMRHDVSIAATLAASIDALGDHARGVLDIASVFESLPLPSDTLIHVVAGLAGTDSTAARSVVELGIADLASHSLARLDHCTTMVHRLVIDLKRTEETDVPQETVVDLADSALTEARS